MIENPNWTAYNAAQSEEKTPFAELLADLCSIVLCKVLAHDICVLIQAIQAFNAKLVFVPRNAAYLIAR